MKFNNSYGVVTWDTGSRTQIGSGYCPSVEGDYENDINPEPEYYTIAYHGTSSYASQPLKVYRSRTGTYSSFSGWLKFYHYPSLYSDQERTNTEYSVVWWESYGNDVLKSNYTNNQWQNPVVLSSNGKYPRINSGTGYGGAVSGPSTATWVEGPDHPFLVKTTLTGLSKTSSAEQEITMDYLRRAEIDLSSINTEKSDGLLQGKITLDLMKIQRGEEKKMFETVLDSSDRIKFLDSQPFILNDDNLDIQYVLSVKDLKVEGKANGDILNKEIFTFNFKNSNSDKIQLKKITLQNLLDQGLSTFDIKNTLRIKTDNSEDVCNIGVEWAKEFSPILTDVYLIGETDSLYMSQTNKEAVNSTVSVEEISLLPDKYTLSQNYPNPFNPLTKISYSLPQPEFVRLNVYNVRGQKIKELVNRNMAAGRHQVSFDGSSISSGIYFYSIEAGSYREVKRMLLIK